MKVLLLIAHGSRREASNQEIRDLAMRLAELAGPDFFTVVPSFLELAEPDIQTGVNLCVEAGATQIVAVPYFLAAGRNVVTDIPEELEAAHRRYPQIDLRQSDYLGSHASLPGMLLGLARERSVQHNPSAA